MTKFDEKVAIREEERAKEKNRRWNALLLKSLQTRSQEEVVRSMLDMLVIPLGSKTMLVKSAETEKSAQLVLF
jgi:ATP-dependent DNA ligase